MEAQQSLESAAKFRLAALCSVHGVHDELLLACLTSLKEAAAVRLPEKNGSSSKNQIYVRTDGREDGPSQGSSESVLFQPQSCLQTCSVHFCVSAVIM